MFAKFFHNILYRVSHQGNKNPTSAIQTFSAAESVRAEKNPPKTTVGVGTAKLRFGSLVTSGRWRLTKSGPSSWMKMLRFFRGKRETGGNVKPLMSNETPTVTEVRIYKLSDTK